MNKFAIRKKKLYKSGNSIMIAFPTTFADKLEWKPGEVVDIMYVDDDGTQTIVIGKGLKEND